MKAKRNRSPGTALHKRGSAGAERYCKLMMAQGYLTENRAHNCEDRSKAMNTDDTDKKHSRLTGLDREIAVQAIAALARGTPVEAAYQILAGIEALDSGPDGPMVMLWPKDDGYESFEGQAAWHEAERNRLLERHEFYSQAFPSWRQQENADRGPSPLSRSTQHLPGSPSSPLLVAPSQSALDEAGSKVPEYSSSEPHEDSSDAHGPDANEQA